MLALMEDLLQVLVFLLVSRLVDAAGFVFGINFDQGVFLALAGRGFVHALVMKFVLVRRLYDLDLLLHHLQVALVVEDAWVDHQRHRNRNRPQNLVQVVDEVELGGEEEQQAEQSQVGFSYDIFVHFHIGHAMQDQLVDCDHRFQLLALLQARLTVLGRLRIARARF